VIWSLEFIWTNHLKLGKGSTLLPNHASASMIIGGWNIWARICSCVPSTKIPSTLGRAVNLALSALRCLDRLGILKPWRQYTSHGSYVIASSCSCTQRKAPRTCYPWRRILAICLFLDCNWRVVVHTLQVSPERLERALPEKPKPESFSVQGGTIENSLSSITHMIEDSHSRFQELDKSLKPHCRDVRENLLGQVERYWGLALL